MKIIKKILVLFIASLSIVLLAGCDLFGGKDVLKLTAEKTTIGVGEQVFLTAKLTIGDKEESVLASLLEFTTSDPDVLTVSPAGVVLGVAKGTATVTATKEHNEKTLTASVKIKVVYKVPTPTGLTVVDNVLTWTAVEGAESYQVEINGSKKTATTNSYDLGELAEGTYELKVSAKVGSDLSDPAVISHVIVSAAKEAEYYAEALKAINEDYLSDMKESDFLSPWEYEEYLVIASMMAAYTRGAIQTNISLEKSKDLIGLIASAIDSEVGSSLEMKALIDPIVALGLTPDQLARVLYEVSFVVMGLSIAEALEDIAYYEDRIVNSNQNLQDALNDSSYLYVIQHLKAHGSQDVADHFEEYINDLDQYIYFYDYFGLIEDAYWAVKDDNVISFLDDLVWSYGDDWLLVAFIEHLVADLMQENEDFYINSRDFLETVMDARRANEDVIFYQRNIQDKQNDLIAFNSIKDASSESSAVMINGFKSAIAFILDLYGKLDADLFQTIEALVMSENITPEEIFILKDELVAILQSSIPAAKDFENLFVALITVLNKTLDINPNDLLGLGQMLGLMTHTGANLLLTIVGDVTIEFYSELMQLASTLEKPSDYVDLVLFIGHYLETVADKNKIALEALGSFQSPVLADQVILIAKNFINFVGEDDMQSAMMVLLFDSIVENYQLYQDVGNIFIKYGGEIVGKFLDTNGKLVYDLLATISKVDGSSTPAAPKDVADDFAALFTQFMEYHDLTFAAITDDEIDTIVDFLAIYSQFVFMSFFGVEPGAEIPAELEALVAKFVPEVKAALKDILKLEVLLLNALESNNAAYEMFNLAEHYDQQLMLTLTIQLIKGLDVVLTSENISLIENRLEQVFTKVLLDADFLAFSQIDEEDILGYQAMIGAMLENILPAISKLAKYDYYNLTEAQLLEFYDFLEMFD